MECGGTGSVAAFLNSTEHCRTPSPISMLVWATNIVYIFDIAALTNSRALQSSQASLAVNQRSVSPSIA